MIDTTGAWLGSYWQDGAATRFEATFVQSGNALMGRISDDGPQGEANIQGEVLSRHIAFTKRYFSYPDPIRYIGTITEDGNFMSGRWNLGSRYSGTWEASRSDDTLVAELRKRLAQTISASELNR